MQPRDPCLPWRGILGPGHTPTPASSLLAREGAGCGSVGDVPGAGLASAPLWPSLWMLLGRTERAARAAELQLCAQARREFQCSPGEENGTEVPRLCVLRAQKRLLPLVMLGTKI